jgi:hypothetical protein
MTSGHDKSIKDVEEALAQSQARAKVLEKEIEVAEARHPPTPSDHTEDGGVI